MHEAIFEDDRGCVHQLVKQLHSAVLKKMVTFDRFNLIRLNLIRLNLIRLNLHAVCLGRIDAVDSAVRRCVYNKLAKDSTDVIRPSVR